VACSGIERGTSVRLLSRNGRDVAPWFPELILAAEELPADTLIDGEIVIADDDGCVDFTALQARLSSAQSGVTDCFRTRPRSGRL
jgi:ATP-dependent DNA ligase